jgi:DNA mismatch endonuclease (patch repair protein)
MNSGLRPLLETDGDTSRRMASIRQRGTTPELLVRRTLRTFAIGYRLNVRSLPGSPDIANKRERFVIFVQGCYWHHHTGCNRATIPKRNVAFWREKFAANRRRDAGAIRELRRRGYRVLVVWECQTVDVGRLNARLSHVASAVGRAFDHALFRRAGPMNPPESSSVRCTL